jgi:hypothetical protein
MSNRDTQRSPVMSEFTDIDTLMLILKLYLNMIAYIIEIVCLAQQEPELNNETSPDYCLIDSLTSKRLTWIWYYLHSNAERGLK